MLQPLTKFNSKTVKNKNNYWVSSLLTINSKTMRESARCSFWYLDFRIGKRLITTFKPRKESWQSILGIQFCWILECTWSGNQKSTKGPLFWSQYPRRPKNSIKGFPCHSRTLQHSIRCSSPCLTALLGTETTNWCKNFRSASIRKGKTQPKWYVRILESQCLSGHWYFWTRKTSMSFCRTKKRFPLILKFYPIASSPYTTETIALYTKARKTVHSISWKTHSTNQETTSSRCFLPISKSIRT